MPQLQKLDCCLSALNVEGVRALQPGLRSNRSLKKLDLEYCRLGDEGIRINADALVGNTRIESLDVNNNEITSKGLTAITRLLDSTQLQTIAFVDCNRHVFEDTDATQHFVTTLQQRNSSLQVLPSITPHDFPEDDSEQRQAATCASINESLTRNQQLHRVNKLTLDAATATATSAWRHHDDCENLEQGDYDTCQGSQQCWRHCHFQTIESTFTAFGKTHQATGCCYCCSCCCSCC
jgi:Ran GTPase-activating protein (RanGAP) involved in mRNA processing and transport